MLGQFIIGILFLGLGLGIQAAPPETVAMLSPNLEITSFVLAGFFLIRLVAMTAIDHFAHSSKFRYTLRKSVSVGLASILIIVLLQIWVEDPQALLVAYGLIAAGVAVSLQDVFKNIAGGITILVTGLYRVGNRVAINDNQGDVIDIGLFYTTLLETGSWVDGDQSTGRIMSIPNGAVLAGVVRNYTRDHHYLWDEIKIPITYSSDLSVATNFLLDAAKDKTADFIAAARDSMTTMERRYYVSERTMKPSVYVQATDNWMLLSLRYVVEVRERRQTRSEITTAVLEKIKADDRVTIASETIDIVGFPDRSLNNN